MVEIGSWSEPGGECVPGGGECDGEVHQRDVGEEGGIVRSSKLVGIQGNSFGLNW